MSFTLFYIDDYGNTGAKLDDPKQKLFMLFSAIVPSSRWYAIEQAYEAVIADLADQLGTHDFEIKSSRFFSKYHEPFNKISFDERARVARMIAHAFVGNGAKFLASYIDKTVLQSILIVASKTKQDREISKKYLTPYVLTYANLISRIDRYLQKARRHGLIIIDRQDQYEYLVTSDLYRLMRSKGKMKGIVERPLRSDSKEHTFLQAVDLIAGIYGSHLCNRIHGKRFHERHADTLDLIKKATEELPSFFLDDAGRTVYSSAMAEVLNIPDAQKTADSHLSLLMFGAMIHAITGIQKKG